MTLLISLGMIALALILRILAEREEREAALSPLTDDWEGDGPDFPTHWWT